MPRKKKEEVKEEPKEEKDTTNSTSVTRSIQIATLTASVCVSSTHNKDEIEKLKKIADEIMDKYDR